VNVLLDDWFGLAKPINFVYGIHGVLLVETLHLFPMITLNVVDALAKIDPALEEAAESVGARGLTKWRTITLPLTTPATSRAPCSSSSGPSPTSRRRSCSASTTSSRRRRT